MGGVLTTQCSGYGCGRPLDTADIDPSSSGYCASCRAEFSIKALDLMRHFQSGIERVLVESAKLFSNAQGIADYLGVSLPTLYTWIERYHRLTFKQFKRRFICAASGARCLVVDHASAEYGWKYTISDRLDKVSGSCMCFIEGGDNFFMTTLSVQDLSRVLQAEVTLEPETGVHHLRYPVRLPLLQPREDSDDE
jgi:hypothetical protein